MNMNPRITLGVFAIFAIILAGGIFLVMRTIPAPHHVIEKVISNERFVK